MRTFECWLLVFYKRFEEFQVSCFDCQSQGMSASSQKRKLNYESEKNMLIKMKNSKLKCELKVKGSMTVSTFSLLGN